jgi:type II secretory pathway pseudopilin PulG
MCYAVPTEPRSKGITLIELLIVVTIMMVLLAAAVPRLRPAMEARRVREAARAVNLYLASARSAAMSHGRPCGVVIERLGAEPLCSMNMSQVEVPAPYSGDDLSAAASMRRDNKIPNLFRAKITGPFNSNLVKIGDRVQFDNQGPWYEITVVGAAQLTVVLDTTQGQLVPWTTTASQPMSYTIRRQPVKTAVSPLQIPAGAVVDLSASGSDSGSTAWDSGALPVFIVFSPNGSVEGYTVCIPNDGQYTPAVEPVFLLVGKREKVGGDNLADLDCVWVAVNPHTGMVTSAETHDLAKSSDLMGGR